jgi:hypothetical protein
VRWLLIRFNPLYLLQACLLFFFSSGSYAVVCPAGYPTSTPLASYCTGGFCSGTGNTLGYSAAASCDKFISKNYSGNSAYTGEATSDTQCAVKMYGSIQFFATITHPTGVCPDEYTAGATSCDLKCQPDPCPSAGTVSNDSQTASFVGSSTPTEQCYKSGSSNCRATCTGSSIVTYDDVAGVSNNFCTQLTYTGVSCVTTDALVTPSPTSANTVTPLVSPPKSAADCPPGSGYAEVNNTSMCLRSGTTYSSGSTTTTSGAGSTTQTTTTTINKDGTTTTTTKTSGTDTAGNATGTLTTVTNGSINGADGGKGDNKPLDLGPAPAFDSSGLPGEPTFQNKTIANPVLSTSIFSVTASCPPPITFEALGRSFSISFQPICDLADIIRGIVLLLAAIVAIRAVVTK